MGFVKQDEDGPSSAERLPLQSVSGSITDPVSWRAWPTLPRVCMCACVPARFTRSYADDSVAERAGQHMAGAPSRARQGGRGGGEGGGEERIEEANSGWVSGRQQCRPRSGPDGGTRGHIPRWLCLRNAVGAPLRRLPPSFFINRSHLPVLAKRNPLITARARWNNVTRVCAEFSLRADVKERCRSKSYREGEKEREGRREIRGIARSIRGLIFMPAHRRWCPARSEDATSSS